METSRQKYGMSMKASLFAFLIFISASYSLPTPFTGEGCPVYDCTAQSNVVAYKPQHKYTYKLESSSENLLSGATFSSKSNNNGKLHLTATAEVQVITPCQFGLTLSNIQVTGSDGKKHQKLSGLEGKPVQFGMQDGKLVPELCADSTDDISSLNLKRAVASLLQVVSTDQLQTDVFGDCQVEVTVSKSGDGLTTYNTHRDLNRCQRRENIMSNIPSTPYLSNSDSQATPLLKAHMTTEQKIKDGYLQLATSSEIYNYRPFSNEGSGAEVSVNTKLTYKNDVAADSFTAPTASRLRSVVFEAPHGSTTDLSNSEALQSGLKAVYDSTIKGTNANAAHLTHQLVQVMRQSTKDDLLSLYGTAKAGAGYKQKKEAVKAFFNALLHTGTGEAVEVMVKLVKNNEVEEPTLSLFYTSLAFTRHATRESLTAVASLLEGNPARELVLGAGSLAGHYYEQHNHQPTKEIDDLLTKIAKLVGNCAHKNHELENKALAALKAIHNAHYIPESVADKIKDCAVKSTKRVRSATLDAIQADASNEKLKAVATSIFKDLEEDSELRIKAYLVLVTCPCEVVAATVTEVLENEPVNQVGSYIVTHLRNLRASSNPEKSHARKYLANIRVPANKFSLDARKYSSNAEISYAFDKANAAASAEANVIFSQDSFLPRFTSFNLTTNLFGHSFNLLEVGLRAENLEHILEAYFGPKGYFKTHSPNEMYNTGKDTVNQLAEKIKTRASKAFRGRRSVSKGDLDKMAAKVTMHNDNDNVNLDMYLKMFGAELAFYTYYGDPASLTPSALVDKIFDNVDKIINKAKGFNYELKRQMVLLDSELVYPTATGFPLRLTAASTAALHVHFSGNLDIQAIHKDPKNAVIRFKVMPSAVIEVTGDIQLDFYAATSGLKHAATLHTSTGVDISVKVLNGKGFDLKIDTPLKNQEIITAKSELFATSRDRGQLQKDVALQFSGPRKDYHGCYDQLSVVTGLTFCGDIGFPFEGLPKKGPIFPLDGPAKLVIKVQQDDKTLTGYNLRAFYDDKDPDHKSVEISFKTTDSEVDRTVSFILEGSKKPNYEIKFSVKTPIQNFESTSVSATLVNNAQEHSLTGQLEFGGNKYLAKVGLQVTGDETKHAVYKPMLEYSGPNSGDGKKEYQLDGTITMHRNEEALERSYTFSELRLTTPGNKYGLDGSVSRKDHAYSCDLTVKYENLGQSVQVKFDVNKIPDGYHLYFEGHASQYPDLAFAINYDNKHAKGFLENKLKVHHGTDLKSEANCFSVSQSYKYESGGENSKDFSLTTKNQVSYPALEMKYHFDGEMTQKSVHYILEAGMDQHLLSSELSFKFGLPDPSGQQNPKDPGGYELNFKAGAGGKTIVVNSGRQVVTSDTSKLHFEVELQPKGTFFKIMSDVTHRLQRNDFKVKLTSVITRSGTPDTYTLCTGLQSNPDSCEGHVMLSKGEEEFFLIKGEAKHGEVETGTFTILLKGYLEGSGTYNHAKGKSEGSLQANLVSPKLDRKVSVNGELKPGAKATTSIATLAILLNADKDPNNKIVLESTIDMNKDGRTFDTKSTLQIVEQKFGLTLKGVCLNRTPIDSGVLGSIDGELELPSGLKISLVSSLAQIQPKDGNGFQANFKFDDGQGAKISYEGQYSRVAGFAVPAYDVSGKLNLVAPNKKGVTLQMSINNRLVDGHQSIDYKFDLTGSSMPQPLHTTLTADLLDHPKYHFKTNYGDKISLDVSGAFSLKDKVDKAAEVNFELKSTIEGYESIKGSQSFNLHTTPEACKLTGKERLEVNGGRKYEIEVDADFGRSDSNHHGSSKITLYLGPDETEPRVFTNTYDYKGPGILKATRDTPQVLTTSSSLKQGTTNFGLNSKMDLPGDGSNSGKFKIEMLTPVEGYEILMIEADHKNVKGSKLFEAKIDYTFGETRKYHVDAKVDLSEQKRSFGVTVTKQGESNPALKFLVAYTKLTAIEIDGEVSVYLGGEKPRSMAVSGHAKYPGGLDEFEASLVVDSDTFNLHQVKVEITNKPGSKGGRRINVSAQSPEKNYFQGSTNYQRKEDGRTLVHEGQGTIKFGEESRTSSFKLVSKTFTREKDSEAGFDVSLNAELNGSKGKQTLNCQTVLTNKALKVFNKFCDEENKCTVLEISNIVKSYELSEMNIENKLTVDLQHVSGAPAFSITGKYHRTKFEFEHFVEAVLGKDATATKYVYEAFIKHHKAGLHLTLPQRTMTLDGVLTTPEDNPKTKKEGSRNYKLEVTLALDKVRKPDQILTIISTMDVNNGKDGVIYLSNTKVTHPVLGKDLAIKSKASYGTEILRESSILFDVFKNKNQAIELTIKNDKIPINGGYNFTTAISVTSKGQNIDIQIRNHAVATKSEIGFGSITTIKDDKLGTSETGIQFFATLENVFALLRTHNCELLRFQGECKRVKGEDVKSHFDLSVLETLAVEGESLGYKHFKYQGYDKSKPDERLVYSADMEWNKAIIVQAEQVTGGAAASLFKMQVSLDSANFMKMEQSVNNDQIKASLEKLQQGAKAAGERLTSLVTDISKDATSRSKASLEAMKKAQPNLKPLMNHCKEIYQAIQEELKADGSAQELVDIVKNLVAGIAKAVTKTIETFSEHVDKITTKLQEFSTKFSELLGKLGPVITEAAGKISKALANVFVTVLEIFTKISGKILEVLKENSAEIQKYFSLIEDFVKEQSHQLGELMTQVREYAEEFIHTILEQIKSLPLIDTIKDRYKEVYDSFLVRFEGAFHEVADYLKEVLPTEDLKELVECIVKYIDKKIKKEPVDEVAEMQKLFQQLVKTVKSLLQVIGAASPPGLQGYNLDAVLKLAITPVSMETLLSLPKWFSVRLSVIDLLASDDLPSAADLLATYSVPRHFDDLLPPHRAFAQISASQHFFTFDGDHYTLKGDCQYLLARDFDDGNFSLTVDLAGGKLRSVSLVDNTDNVELRSDHTVLLNGQAVELPMHHNDIAMFRTMNKVHVKSRAGVYVTCDLHHDLCTFAINGFYFGKTRGLLGTITNEKYDDMALPNGKIATTVQQFANNYKLSESCKNQAPVAHKHNSHKECGRAFTQQTSLSPCFPFVDVTPYRQACDDALDEDKSPEGTLKAICEASAAYVAKCQDATFLRPSLPTNCAHCSLGGKNVEVGTSATVKAPHGKADIVILVEQTAENEAAYNDFLTPFIAELTGDLNKKGINDIHFAMIGFGGPGQKWPALFTSNGKFAFDGKRPAQLTFGAKAAETPTEDRHPILVFLDKVRDYTSIQLGLSNVGQAFDQAIIFPYRADAAKSILILKNSPCNKSPFPLSLLQLTMMRARENLRDRGIVFGFLQPFEMTTTADKKIAGFDADNALTYSKKPVDPLLRSEIDYSSDACASFINTVKPTVYNMKTFKDSKGGQRKQIITTASARFASLLSGTEVTQNCVCRLRGGLHTEERCSVSATKEVSKSAGQKKAGKA